MTAAEKVRNVAVPSGTPRQRLDKFLARECPEYSRAQIQRWIRDGQIRVNGEARDPKSPVQGGEVICMTPPRVQPTVLQPQVIPLDVLYEDDDLLVINKAPGMVVHPGAGQREGTLVHALLAHCRELSGIGGVERPGIVHRLDRGTSGLLVVAKHDRAHRGLSAQFAARQVEKTYLALCHGRLAGTGQVDAGIGRHPTDRKRMSTKSRRARPALTYWTAHESFGPACTLLAVRIATGRTHQIRVHCSSLGHPLVGDATYGSAHAMRLVPTESRSVLQDFGRPALHAWQLALRHPMTDVACHWTAPLAEDFACLLERLRMVRDGA